MTIYLDHAATTPMRPEAVEAMIPWLRTNFGNPSGSHAVARAARQAVDEAREVVAAALGCQPGEVVFTAGGTEADNLAVAGAVGAARVRGGAEATAVCSAVEHHAVLHAVEAVGGRVVPVDGDGIIDLDRLSDALDPDVAVVSVMLANNETGTIQPLASVAETVRRKVPAALVHTDAVQAMPWLDVASLTACADLVAVAAHKFGGPKGVGALVVRDGAPLEPLLRGGGQERDRRSGTHNVAGIVAMAAAVQATLASREAAAVRVAALRDELAAAVIGAIEGAVLTGADGPLLPNLCHLRLPGVESESLLMLLDDAGVCASAGSACTSGAMEPSHVLTAMGIPRCEALSSLRLSLGWPSTAEDTAGAFAAVVRAVEQLHARTGVLS
jgi:cysteine desulfurase